MSVSAVRSIAIALCLTAVSVDAAGQTAPRRQGQTDTPPPSADCRIKGNVNSKDERIYHPPGCRDWGRTMIDPARGDRWFCSEAEARAAGWRRTRACRSRTGRS